MPQVKKGPKKKLIADYRQLRRSLGMNQTEFWGRLGVTQSGGCRYEQSRKPPKPVAVLAYIVYVEKRDTDAREFK
jgi:DNA-binding transcriptional regulator YiaG